MNRLDRSVRAYRRLLVLYPKKFRDEYGEDMVFTFQEMLRDLPPRRVWPRTLRDAASSVVIQRLESPMSKSMLPAVGFASAAALVLIIVSGRGVENLYAFVGTVLVVAACLVTALLYWQANRAYVEPSGDVHRYWLHVLGTGAALIGLVNLGPSFDVDAPWLLLFSAIIVGVVLVAVGVLLGVWHGVARVRAERTA